MRLVVYALGVRSHGVAGHLLQHQMHGLLQQYYHQKLMEVLDRLAILMIAQLLEEVVQGHQQLAVKNPQTLLVYGVRTHVHLRHLDYWHQVTLQLLLTALEVRKQDRVVLICLVLLRVHRKILLHGGQQERLRNWYFCLLLSRLFL